MPHDDLMDAIRLTEGKAALKRARLSLRSGKRRMQAGMSAAGMAALYDSVLYGMHYYVASHKRCASLVESVHLWDAVALYHELACAGVFEDPFTFNRFSLMVERALWKESSSCDPQVALAEVENILTQLDVIPINESVLPRRSFAAR